MSPSISPSVNIYNDRTSAANSPPLFLNTIADQALDSLAEIGEHYDGMRHRILEKTRQHTQAPELFQPVAIISQQTKPQLSWRSGLNATADALSGIGDVLVVFSKEHRTGKKEAGKKEYVGTLESILATTGKLGISSAIGIGAAGAATAMLGVGAAPLLIGLGAGTLGFVIAEKIFS